jgi:hypothetical protein
MAMTARQDLERKAEAARISGRITEAVQLFEEIIGADLAEGRMASALSIYQRVIVWRPDDSDLHRRLAELIAGRKEEPSSTAGLARAAGNALFRGVPSAEVAGILRSMTASRFEPGAILVREGEPGESLFLIVSGTVVVKTKAPEGDFVELSRLSAGEFFGEVSLLTSRPRTASVIAETPVEVLELSRNAVGGLRERFPNIDQSLSEIHERRAERTVAAILERRRTDA